MPARAKQTPPRHQLGRDLRLIREQRHLTAAAVAATLGWSESKISRIETALAAISANDLTRLLDLYEVNEPRRAPLIELAAQARQRRRRFHTGGTLPDVYEKYTEFEAEAATISVYCNTVIPGLLQTPEYAKSIAAAAPAPEDEELLSERISVRMVRQAAVFTRQPPPALHIVIDEAVLSRMIGGPSAMRRQLLRVLEVSEAPRTTVQILPFTSGAHAALSGPFVILTFEPDTVPAQVYCDGLTGGVIHKNPDDVELYRRCFNSVANGALDPFESADMIGRAADRLVGPNHPTE
ncbi:helix-turn-helix domain-containing protein [Virgisporangium aliadipatigenens]|nr:helix-turn-helix transcriptional regulator [Virgisporangium aliadipatigenens]